jgi:chromosome segregation ATPase
LRSRSERELDRLECEVKLLLENLENVKRDRNSAKLELEVKETELVSFKERFSQLEQYNQENGAKILKLETRNENLFDDFKAKEEEIEGLSEMLEIAGNGRFNAKILVV